MISSPVDKTRNVIPRWRAFKVAAALDELRSSPPRRRNAEQRPPSSRAYKRNLAAWRHLRSLPNAAELVLSSVVSGKNDDVQEAAEFLLNEQTPAVSSLKKLADRIRSEPADSTEAEIPSVRAQRKFTQFEPRNAIGWTDLALAHFSIGDEKKARRELEIALHLAPENRHVLRAAACFFTNIGHPDTANQLLNRASRTNYDPWLSSAEIATATLAGHHSKHTRKAREAIFRSEFSARDSAELASAVATLELENGNTRQSRKLFKASLENPTENAVAQAQWAAEHRHISVSVDPSYLKEPLAFESVARNAYAVDDWPACVDSLESWSEDQPFLVQPYIVGSFVASEFMEMPARALDFTETGLRIHPNDVTLHNNAAVSFAKLKKFDEAASSLDRAFALSDKANKHEQPLLKATKGLLAFRQGNPVAGRNLYWEAIIEAVEAKNRHLARRAYLHLVYEEVLHNPFRATTARKALAPFEKLEKGTIFEKEIHAAIQRIDLLVEMSSDGRHIETNDFRLGNSSFDPVMYELTTSGDN